MASESSSGSQKSMKSRGARIVGQVDLEEMRGVPRDLGLHAYAFDTQGELLGSTKVGRNGSFEVATELREPQDITVVVSPADDPKKFRGEATYRQQYAAADWISEDNRLRLNAEIYLLKYIWWPWWPQRICVSGHVRKVHTEDGHTETCPVPYVKVEIFDVDREWCWWDYIVAALPDLLDRKVVRIPDLIKERPPRFKRIPLPDPPPELINPREVAAAALMRDLGGYVSLDPQPLPPRELADSLVNMNIRGLAAGSAAGYNPQPDPPLPAMQFERIGEMKSVAPAVAERLDKLTLTSKLAPWIVWPGCFYSKELVCTTYTNCSGYFECCFDWYPWHLRNGRLRFDKRPDIVIKVTQVIGGVEHVIYLDPYTSTRWNVTNAHIDLFLDDEEIVCGSGCMGEPLPGEQMATILRIGADPVWKIDQASGMYHVPGTDNAAYGGSLYLFGAFSDDLLGGNVTEKTYYRLSYAEKTGPGTPPDSDFTPIRTQFMVQRALPEGSFDPSYLIGPKPVNGTPDLYEVMDTDHWWIIDGFAGLTTPGDTLLARWNTGFEVDEDDYILRMEMFDWQGNKITTMNFPDHGGDGSGADPDPVPVVVDHLDLKVHIDNKKVEFSLGTPATNPCGVVPWLPTPELTFTVHAAQDNGRVHRWDLDFTKGVDPTRINIHEDSYPTGQSPVNEDVTTNKLRLSEPVTPSNPTGDLQGTCAFALILHAWRHVRGNAGFIYEGEKIYALAIEKCPVCPECD